MLRPEEGSKAGEYSLPYSTKRKPHRAASRHRSSREHSPSGIVKPNSGALPANWSFRPQSINSGGIFRSPERCVVFLSLPLIITAHAWHQIPCPGKRERPATTVRPEVLLYAKETSYTFTCMYRWTWNLRIDPRNNIFLLLKINQYQQIRYFYFLKRSS